MTKANELVDAKINYISFVRKGANGIPLCILKSDESGEGLDLSALNKSDDTPVKDDVRIEITLPKNDGDADKVDEGLAPEVIQKLNLMAIGRSMQSASRHLRHGARAGYRYVRNPGVPRNLQTAAGHIIRSRAGGVGVLSGAVAGRVVSAGANRIARARQAGRRTAMGLRAGYGLARDMSRNGINGYTHKTPAMQAWLRAYQQGSRRSLSLGASAGIAHTQAAHRVNQFRSWVRREGVRNGGYWRRSA